MSYHCKRVTSYKQMGEKNVTWTSASWLLPRLRKIMFPLGIKMSSQNIIEQSFSLPNFESKFLPLCTFFFFFNQQYPVSPADGGHEHKFRLDSVKGSFEDPCRLPHGLRDEMLLSLLPGNHRWEDFLAFSVPVNSGLSFPELHPLLFPSGKLSLYHHYQQISKCSHTSHSHLFQTMRPGADCQKENIMLFSVLTAKNNFRGVLL